MSKVLKARGKHAIDEGYYDLVREFPLRPIRSAKDHQAAQRILDRTIGRADLTAGERDYLEALLHFLEDYERDRSAALLTAMKPLELLQHLMEENRMSTTELGDILGSRGLASEVLNGKRGLSKMLI